MKKSDLVDNLAEKLSHFSRKEVDLILDTVFGKMSKTLAKGERIEIRGFGSFEVRTRKARQARNPKSGEKVFVGTRRVPFFKVGKELRERINGETSSEQPEKILKVSGE
jgi:integration host factor subunit beta